MNPMGQHIDANDLAVLAEGGRDRADPAVLAHLAVCADCLDAYAEAVRCIDAELAAAAPAAAPATVLRFVPRRRRRGAAAWASGGLAAAAVLLLLLMPMGRPGADAFDPRAILQARLADLSGEGLLLPGVERLAADGGARYRAGADPSGIDALLEPLARRLGADPADADAAYWLAAGYLASGRLSYADDVLRRALQRHPDAADLRRLDAATAYRLNELARAESVLRQLLTQAPADANARFNLALIESETGRAAAALPVLRDLAADDAHPAARDRARELISRLEP